MIWDRLAPFYDFFETVYNGKCYKGIAEKIKEYVTEDDNVLECACGTGLLTLPMVQKCKNLIATDTSVGMLRQARKKVAKYANTNIEKASILELPYKENTFDVVVAANVIHLLNEPEKAISELKRVCKPSGKIILPVYINKEKKNSVVAAKLLSVLGVKFARQFSLDSYKEFIASHNMTQVAYRVVDGHMPCAFAIITNN